MSTDAIDISFATCKHTLKQSEVVPKTTITSTDSTYFEQSLYLNHVECTNQSQDEMSHTKRDQGSPKNRHASVNENISVVAERSRDGDGISDKGKTVTYACKLCKKTFKYNQNLRRHMLRHSNINRIVCEVCGKLYVKGYFAQHFKTHSSFKEYKCDSCCQTFKSSHSLFRHRLLHSGEESSTWTCSKCSEVYTCKRRYEAHLRMHRAKHLEKVTCKICHIILQRRYFSEHMKRKHYTDQRYCCFVCNMRFSLLSQLNRHSETHSGDNVFNCQICNKQFSCKTGLRLHLSIHSEEKRYKCCSCNKQYYRLSSLKRHNLVHEGLKPYRCGECSKAFFYASSLKSHFQIHLTGHTYRCEMCYKTFSTKNSLNVHKKRHTKQYECGICHHTFHLPSQLRKHMQSHTVNKDGLKVKSVCTICNKRFRNLQLHMRKHRKEDKFKCDICCTLFDRVKSYNDLCNHILEKVPRCRLCSKIFKKGHNLEKHLEKHLVPQEKKLKPKSKKKCQECNREFGDTHSYRQHIESHDPNKQFCCEYCHERFYSFTSLYKHLGIHNG